jgi:GT2 family glycosyltransferase
LANQGEGDIIVFIDADSIPNPDALMYSIDHVVRCKKWMYPFSTYYNLTEAGSKDFMDSPPWVTWRPEDGYEYEYVFPDPVFPGDRPAAVGGSMVIHRDAWKEVRGYDERFKGWGGEDRAMSMALMTLIGEGPRYPAPIYHLWHPAPEAERFDHPNWKSNQELLERYQAVYQGRVSMRALLDDGVPC